MAPPTAGEVGDENAGHDEIDIAVLETYGLGPYSSGIKKRGGGGIKEMAKKINDLCGINESDTGLAETGQWDLGSDKADDAGAAAASAN